MKALSANVRIAGDTSGAPFHGQIGVRGEQPCIAVDERERLTPEYSVLFARGLIRYQDLVNTRSAREETQTA